MVCLDALPSSQLHHAGRGQTLIGVIQACSRHSQTKTGTQTCHQRVPRSRGFLMVEIVLQTMCMKLMHYYVTSSIPDDD